MAKRLNKKLVAGLTLMGMLVTTAAGIVLVINMPRKDPEPIANQAKEMLEDKNYTDAAAQFKRAASRARENEKYTPEGIGYLLEAGDAYLHAGSAADAMACWRAVMNSDPQNQEAQERIVDFSMEVAKVRGGSAWQGVREAAEKLIDINPKNFDGLNALGQALIYQRGLDEKNAEKGEKMLEEAVQGDQANPEYARSLAMYYFMENRTDDAAQLFDTLIQTIKREDPVDQEKLAEAYRYRGNYYSQMVRKLQQEMQQRPGSERQYEERIQKAEDQTVADLQKAVELNPDSVDALVELGAYWHTKQATAADEKERDAQREEYQAKAEKLYKEAINKDPEHFEGYLRLAGLYAQQGDPGRGVEVLMERISKGVSREHYLSWLHMFYMERTRDFAFQLLENTYYRLPREVESQSEYNERTAEIMNQMEDLYNRTVANTREGEDSVSALFMKARILILQDKRTEAIKVLEQADKAAMESSLDIKRKLAALYNDNGQPGLAEEELSKILNRHSNEPILWVTMAMIQNNLKKYDKALDAADNALRLDPGNRMALVEKAKAFRGKGNIEAALKIRSQIAEEMEQVNPLNAKLVKALNLQMAAVSGDTVDQPKLLESEKLLRDILAEEPTNMRALQGLAVVVRNNKERLPEITETLDQTRQAVNQKLQELDSQTDRDTSADRVALQRVNNTIDLIKLFADDQLTEDEKLQRWEKIVRQGEDPYEVALQLFQMYRRIPGKQQEAYEQLQKAYELKPEEPALIEQLFFIALDLQHWDDAKKYLGDLIANDIDPSGGHFYRGRMLMARTDQQNHLTEAAEQLRLGLEAFPSFSNGRLWLGMVQLELNNAQEALDNFQEAYRLNPGNAQAVIGIARAAEVLGNQDLKKEYLSIAQQLAPEHPWVKEEMQDRQDELDPQEGITRREEIRKNNPDDLLNLLRLAELYARVGQPEKAEEVFKEAHAKKPDSLEIADKYSKFLRDQVARPGDAEKLLEEVVEANKDNESLLHAAAQVMLAAHLYTMHERGGPDAPDLERVNQAFLKAGQISQSPTVLLEVGTYFMTVDDLAEAEKWLRRAIDNSRDKPEHRQFFVSAHRRLLDLLTQLRDADRADEILQEIDYHQRNIDEDYALLARSEFFASIGRDGDALKSFNAYIEKNPNNPIGYYRRALVHFRRSDYPAAIADLNEVKRINPRFGNYEPRMTLAQAYELNDQPEKAIDEYRVMVDAGVGGFDVVRRLFDLYLKLERLDVAANMVRPLADRQPENPLWTYFQAEIASRKGNTEQAVSLGKEAVVKSNYSSNMLGFVFDQMLSNKRYDELVNYINELPDEVKGQGVLMTLSAAYAGKGDLDKALDIAVDAYGHEKGRIQLFVQLFGRNMRNQNLFDPEKIQAALESRVQDGSGNRAERLMLAVVYGQRKQYDQAIALLEKLADESSTQNPAGAMEKFYLLQQLAQVEYQTDDYQQSRKYYEQALEINEDDPGLLNNLAYLLMDKLEDPQSALPYARKAARMLPGNASVLDTLGWNFVLLGEYDEGIGWLHKAVETDPDNASIYYHLGVAFQGRSDSPNAKEDDREQARKMCRRAHDLIVEAGVDPNDELARIADLGDKLGLSLSKSL